MTKLAKESESNRQHGHVLENLNEVVDPTAEFLDATPPTSIIWVTDDQGVATLIGNEESDFTGQSMSDLLASGWKDTIHPADVSNFLAVWEQAIRNRERFSHTFRKRRFDGNFVWFRSQGIPRFGHNNEFLGHIGFCIDISEQVEAQSKLSASQSMLVSILDNSPFLTSYADSSLTYQYVNCSYAELWGRKRSEIVGRRIAEITGDFFQQLIPALDRTLQGETVYHEKKITSDTGEDKWLEITHVPEFDNQNNVVGFYCFVNDATESRKHERILQLVQDHVPAMVLLLNTNFELRYANVEFCRAMNYQKTEIVGCSLKTLIGDEAFQSCRLNLERAKQGEKSSLEVLLPMADGCHLNALVRLVPESDTDGVLAGICVLILDISNLRNTQLELQRSEARFKLAINGSSVGIIEFDSEDEDWVFADHIESLLGYSPGYLENSRSRIRSLIHPEDLKQNEVAKRSTIDGNESKFEIRMRNSQNEFRWFEVFTKPNTNADWNFSRIAGTITDIDDRKKAELNALEQIRMRDEFLAVLSHELRNPLAAITLTLDCLELEESSEVTSDSMEILKRNSVNISKLLDDLLDVSRITHQRIEYKKSVHDLNQIVRESTASFQPFLQNQNFFLDVCSESLPIFADESRIGQLISNLVENAIKYTSDKGSIRVMTQRMGDDAIVRVKDDGIGIEAGFNSRIFEMFFRAKNQECQHGGGMGVGLYLVRKIAQAHNGTVEVHSQGSGQGSEFVVRIPLSKKRNLAEEIPFSHQDQLLKFAVVEDNPDIRNVLSKLLISNGFQVQLYADGETAFHQIPMVRPDFAIIDIGLPGKNGMDLARELRSCEELENLKLIALTGYGQKHDREMVANSGFDIHLVKPITLEKLRRAVSELASAETEG